ncbi:MAG: heat-shock protein [Gammaproteobacteria bacterium]|nr:heat-shock protein [Gammaproteobacteria bacterium]
MTTKAAESATTRLDKWLWAARFYKTRGLAQAMIDGGKVHYNGQRCKAARSVQLGALVYLWQGHDEREVEVIAISDKRGNATAAQQLYRETAASLARRQAAAEARRLQAHEPDEGPRPDKQQRRQRRQLKADHCDF